MAYVDRKSSLNRTAAIVCVGALHGAALLALITGFGVEYTRDIIANLPTREYRDPPPPPPPEETVPKTQPRSTEPALTVPPMPVPMPRIPDAPRATPRPDTVVPPPTTFIIEPPVAPRAEPRPAPAVPARDARPANAPSGWFSTDDYPSRDLREGNEGLVRFDLRIDARGRVQECAITRSSGHDGLDRATCRLAERRARFEPASDATGATVAGRYSGTVRWVIPD